MKISIIDLALVRSAIPQGQGAELARKIGFHKNTLSRKLNGTLRLSVTELNNIARHLGVSVEEFLKVEEVQEPDFWQQVDQSYKVLRDFPKTWSRELEERGQLVNTLSDGLDTEEVWTADGEVLDA